MTEADDTDKIIAQINAKIGQSPNRDWYAGRLDSMGAHASPLQRQRFDVAVAYLEHHHTTYSSEGVAVVDRRAVLQELKAIDFHKDVRITKLEADDRVHQYNNGEPGRYFTESGVDQDRLAISRGNGERTRQHSVQPVTKSIPVLKSSANANFDYWTKHRLTRAEVERQAHDRQEPGVHKTVDRGPQTDRADLAKRHYVTDKDGNRRLVSGEYVNGGGVQYYIPRTYHSRFGAAEHSGGFNESRTRPSNDMTATSLIVEKSAETRHRHGANAPVHDDNRHLTHGIDRGHSHSAQRRGGRGRG